jgi:hypothetical protein
MSQACGLRTLAALDARLLDDRAPRQTVSLREDAP